MCANISVLQSSHGVGGYEGCFLVIACAFSHIAIIFLCQPYSLHPRLQPENIKNRTVQYILEVYQKTGGQAVKDKMILN